MCVLELSFSLSGCKHVRETVTYLAVNAVIKMQYYHHFLFIDPCFPSAFGSNITNWLEFEHYIEEFHFHIALACLYFTIGLKYVEHLIWELLGKLWLSWNICVGSRVGRGKEKSGREEKLQSLTMMIDLTNVSNTVL